MLLVTWATLELDADLLCSRLRFRRLLLYHVLCEDSRFLSPQSSQALLFQPITSLGLSLQHVTCLVLFCSLNQTDQSDKVQQITCRPGKPSRCGCFLSTIAC